MSAFQKAYEYGYKYVETDVTFTADGVPVLLHDDSIDRTSNGSGKIASLTYEYVRTLDFGSWKSKEYAGEKYHHLMNLWHFVLPMIFIHMWN